MKAALIAIVVLAASTGGYALQSDELLLLCNADRPESCELARYYAQARSVPKDRIVPLHMTLQDDDIRPADFNTQIREPVRSLLEHAHLAGKVRCLVTFYG